MRRLPLFAFVVALASPHVAAAQIAPDAAHLLNDARSKSGDWSRVAILRATGSITQSGLDGTYALDHDVRDGRSDERATFAPFATRDVWDGKTAWHQDNSGGVHPHDGAYSQRRLVDDAWLVKRGWLREDALGAYVGPVAHAGGLDRVTVVPSGGEAMDLSFDRSTRDLVKVRRTRPTSTDTITYGDFRDVDGLRLPFAIDTVSSDGDATSVKVARIEAVPRVNADIFARPRMPDDTRIGATAVTVPLDARAGKLTIVARINGHGPYRFIFDTGGHSILSPAVARELGLAVTGHGQTDGAGEGTLPEQYARIDRVDIGGADSRGASAGGVTVFDQPFYIIEMGYPTLERGEGPPLGGLLGLEMLERLGVRIDYPGKRMTFTAFDRHRLDPRATVVPLTFDDDIPLVDASLDGHPGVFALDTGNANTIFVQREWAEKVGLATRMRAGLETASFGAGGVSRNWASRLGPFEIGGATLDHQIGRYAEDRRGAFASRTEAGNVGTDVLANFVVDFDYRRGLMAWRYVGAAEPPFSRSGVRALKDRPEDFLVITVADGSPAAEAGVQAKDRLVALNGRPAAQLSGADLLDAFQQAPGTPVRVRVARGEQRIDATIVLREMLP
jgi:hypothetical protein